MDFVAAILSEGGKSGLHGGTVPGNARRGRPQGQCHRKYTAAQLACAGRAARVKRCGKSAPRRRQRRRQGKPHREQDQGGAAGGAARAALPGGPSRRRSGRSHEAPGNGRPRGMAVAALSGGTEPGLQTVWHLEHNENLVISTCPDRAADETSAG